MSIPPTESQEALPSMRRCVSEPACWRGGCYQSSIAGAFARALRSRKLPKSSRNKIERRPARAQLELSAEFRDNHRLSVNCYFVTYGSPQTTRNSIEREQFLQD